MEKNVQQDSAASEEIVISEEVVKEYYEAESWQFSGCGD